MCVVCLMFINGCYRVIIKCLIDLGILVMTMCWRLNTLYRSTIAGSFKNNSKNKKRKNYEIMKTEKRK